MGEAKHLKWQHREHRDGERAEFKVCGLRAFVGDADGDWSWWTVSKGRQKLSEGTCHGYDPYHFDVALGEAEEALRRIINARIAELRAAPSESPSTKEASDA